MIKFPTMPSNDNGTGPWTHCPMITVLGHGHTDPPMITVMGLGPTDPPMKTVLGLGPTDPLMKMVMGLGPTNPPMVLGTGPADHSMIMVLVPPWTHLPSNLKKKLPMQYTALKTKRMLYSISYAQNMCKCI